MLLGETHCRFVWSVVIYLRILRRRVKNKIEQEIQETSVYPSSDWNRPADKPGPVVVHVWREDGRIPLACNLLNISAANLAAERPRACATRSFLARNSKRLIIYAATVWLRGKRMGRKGHRTPRPLAQSPPHSDAITVYLLG